MNLIRPMIKDSLTKFIEDSGQRFTDTSFWTDSFGPRIPDTENDFILREVHFKPDQADKIYNFVSIGGSIQIFTFGTT